MKYFSNLTNDNNKKLISFARIACEIAIDKLRYEVTQLLLLNAQQPWIDHVNRQDYVGKWDVLPLRCQQQFVEAHPILQGFSIAAGDQWENLPVLEHCPQIKSIFAQLHCPVKAARLMRLAAGAEIKPHRDHGLGMEFGEARLHVPIHTSNAVNFLVDKHRIPMRAGELWYFNADQVHEVYNHGDVDRINLVIDCVVNDWLREKILDGAAHE